MIKNFAMGKAKHRNNTSNNLEKRSIQSGKSKDILLSSDEMQDRVIDWVTFYRRNLHRFVEHYLGLPLHLYQIVTLFLMNLFPSIVIIACRAAAKSYMIAIYACARAILYPGTKIVIASATKRQSKLIVSEKIKKELMPNSATLRKEIADIKDGVNDIEVIFHNSSSIVVVPANENARGYRSNVTIFEEFRMIKKEIVDDVLVPFSFIRQPPYLTNPKYSHLQEEPIFIYISSAYYKNHWMWKLIVDSTRDMYGKMESMVIGFDLSITLKHNIKTKNQLLKAKQQSDPFSFAMEYENVMMGQNANAYFTFDLLQSCQKLKKAFYPIDNVDFLAKTKVKKMEKQKGEIRVVSMDISMIEGDINDNTTWTLIRAVPHNDGYKRIIPYIESMNGGDTDKQAIRSKQLFYDFDADYFVIDTLNAGISVYDRLAKVLTDDTRDCEYPAWSCFNDEKTSNRITIQNSLPIVFSIKASPQLNHTIVTDLRTTLKDKKMELLIDSSKAKDYLDQSNNEYINSEDLHKKLWFETPYNETDFLVNEMVNLEHILTENRLIKVKETSGNRKDRYTSLSYGNYFIGILEKELLSDNAEYDFVFESFSF